MKPPKTAVETYWRPSKKTVSDADMQAFAERMHNRMQELGMTNSDLAREAFGVQIDADGVERVVDREKIGIYLRGQGLPGETKMRALAKALKMTLKELAPPVSVPVREARSSKALPEASRLPAKVAEGVVQWEPQDDGMVILAVRQRMSIEDATEIAAMITRAARHGR